MNRLQNKVVLVTGGSSGIGLDAAKKMSEEGAVVYITGRNVKRLESALECFENQVFAITADSSSKEDMDRVCEMIRQQHGRVDVIFANAGVGKYVSLKDLTEEHIDWTFNINVTNIK